jgi:hypothetical protein
MFRALIANTQEAFAVSLQPLLSQLTLYARIIPNAVYPVPPEDEQIMLETCKGPLFSIN